MLKRKSIPFEVLKANRHPADPRIVLTERQDIFMAAAACEDFHGAILRRAEKPQRKKPAFDYLSAAWAARPNKTQTTNVTYNSARIDGEGNPMLIETPVKPILTPMIKVCRRIKEPAVNEFGYFILTNLWQGTHKHDEYDVLNTVLGDKKKSHGLGTGWHNEKGDPLYALEDDWFSFRRGFPHFTPDYDVEKHGDRFVVVVSI